MVLVTLALASTLLLGAPARADVLLPPSGKLYAGLTGGLTTDVFARQTGRRPPVFQFFTNYGASPGWPFAPAGLPVLRDVRGEPGLAFRPRARRGRAADAAHLPHQWVRTRGRPASADR